MDCFQHDAPSALVSNMQIEAREMETFPVLIGDHVAHFHEVDGGHNRDYLYDIVNLIHTVQGPGSPHLVNTDELSHSIELHLTDNYYTLTVDGMRVHDNYPHDDYVLSLQIDSAMSGPHSFSEPLTADTDKRETRHET